MSPAWSDLTPLPSPNQKPEKLNPATVRFYEERCWTSDYIEVTPGRSHIEYEQHVLERRLKPAGSSASMSSDSSTKFTLNGSPHKKLTRTVRWIAFNMPEGMVMTLAEKKRQNGDSPHNLEGCGLTVDLIGRGETVGVDLEERSTFGLLSSTVAFFSWRSVVLDHGAFELFARTNFKGERLTIFLSDWKANKHGDIHKYDLRGWSMNRKARSVRFKAIDSTVRIYLYGTSKKYDLTNIAGWLDIHEISNLYELNTSASLKVAQGFGWGAISPTKENVERFDIDEKCIKFILKRIDRCELRNNASGPARVEHEFVYTTTISKTLTATTSLSSAVGLEAVAKDPVSQSSLTVKFQMAGSESKQSGDKYTERLEQKRKIAVDAPAHTTRFGRLEVYHSHVVNLKHTVKVRRWYKMALPDARQDDADRNLWYRDERVPISISSNTDGLGFATKSVSIVEDADETTSRSMNISSETLVSSAILFTVGVVGVFLSSKLPMLGYDVV